MATIKTLEALDLTLWRRFSLVLTIRDRLIGGIPKSPDMIEGWLNAVVKDESRMRQAAAETVAAMTPQAPTVEQMEELSEKAWVGFKANKEGLYYEGRCLKAAFKEAANVLRPKLDITALKARVAERLFVEEDILPLGVVQPDGFRETPIHAMTPQGPIHALKRADYVTAPTLRCTLKLLDEAYTTKTNKDKILPEVVLEALLLYMAENGIGAERSQGAGKFDLVEFKEIT